MVDFSMVDIIIVGLILFLSLKGLVNGFLKELFNFIGLIGGVYFASRMNATVGEFINSNIFPVENEPALKLVGFISILLAIWMVANLISSIFEKTLPTGVDVFSRIFGYALTIVRYIAIFALIIASLQNVELIAKKLAKHSANSQIIPTLNEIGVDLLNMKSREANATMELNTTKEIDLESFNMEQNDTNRTKE
ncbi:CvpA family protein [Sulfurovum sp. bin170]|uniref:CvpA family protein n=1 Tax=Sulfurovum sp. bin170 TaxID=2695268 RepID=UPI0013E03470|nr:CvpA family protein [Sulfurovum sp. bin170]NEW60019.1 CvpA family protein [Sulfurovum sp. bin170]